MRELVVKRCNKCGAIVRVINDCNCEDCGIKCCDEKMQELKANSVDAAFEKHVPNYEKKDGKLIVNVNHVMDDDHYIEWVCLVNENREDYVYFKPGNPVKCEFENVNEGILYSYCNKHLLWKKEI